MSILFISDIHLCNKNPIVIDAFLNFLNNKITHIQALYILGDLFEVWLGDDEQNILHINIANALKELNKKKIACYFIHGNHDFLLGSAYAKSCGMILLPSKKIITLPSGIRIMLLHGDTLCVNDSSYQKFRQYIRHTKIKKLFLSLPLFLRAKIYKIINRCCIKNNKNRIKNNEIISSSVIIKILKKNHAKIMIHGHVHQLKIHKIYNIYINNKIDTFQRITLDAWNKYGSMIEINDINKTIIVSKFLLK